MSRTPTLQVESSARHGIGLKLAVLALSGVLLGAFGLGLSSGLLSGFDVVKAVFTAMTLGLGSSLLVATLYGGFLPQRLVLDEGAVTYVHGRRTIVMPWAEVTKVRVMGVTYPQVRSYAIQFRALDRAANRDIVVASDFARENLLRVVRVVEEKAASIGFELSVTE